MMRIAVTLLAAGFALLAPRIAGAQTPAGPTLADLAFMTGCWRGEFANGGALEEFYTPPSDNLMLGLSRYLRGNSAVQFEFTRITADSSGIALLPHPGARPSEHTFRLTTLEASSVTFEAPEHDFPKRIRYALDADGSLTARIDGGTDESRSQEWRMEPVPCRPAGAANIGFPLPDPADVVSAVGVDADRNGVAYPTALEPDDVVPIAPGATIPSMPPAHDPQLASAHAWLVQQPGCRQGSAELGVVEAHMEAFNRHDAAALAAGVAPGFVWLSVAGDEVTVEARGRAELERGMAAYFAEFPDVHSTIEDVVTNGRFVTVRERVRWSSTGGERSQAALAVYEVEDGLLQRVWYFPAGSGG